MAQQGTSVDWSALADEVYSGMAEWRVQHPRARFAEIEQEVDRGLAGLRARMLQDVALRSVQADFRDLPEGGRPCCPQCGAVLEARGKKVRRLTTNHNQAVALARSYAVCPRCGSGVFPLDEELALPAGHLSSFLAETLVRQATWLPFGRASEEVARLTGVRVPESTVRRLTEGAGAAYDAVQTAQVERALPAAPPGPAVQALSVDGAMVPLVGGTRAEVRTLAIGTVQARKEGLHARAQQAVATTDLSYFSRMADHETFTRLALVETHRRGVETAGTVCALFDGARWIQTFLDQHRPDAVRILDWPHAVGYLGAVARALYGMDTPPAKTWLAQQKETLLHGEPVRVLATLVDVQALLTPVVAGEQERLLWTLPGPGASDPPWRR